MAFNKARENEWRRWKEAEEKQMRELGVEEDLIASLRVYDWNAFNDDRRFYDHHRETGSYLDIIASSEDHREIRTVEDLLDEIDDPELYQVLCKIDRLTLNIILLRMEGFNAEEIALKLGLTPKAVFRRLDRIKKKIRMLQSR